jgi:hypothetical protein
VSSSASGLAAPQVVEAGLANEPLVGRMYFGNARYSVVRTTSIYMTGTAHIEALIVSGTGYDADMTLAGA